MAHERLLSSFLIVNRIEFIVTKLFFKKEKFDQKK
jgi:hypothetical protein